MQQVKSGPRRSFGDEHKVTLKMVADRAGLSPSPVSRILNGTAVVSDDKRAASRYVDFAMFGAGGRIFQ